MKLFDLHCDTLTALFEKNCDLNSRDTAVSLDGMLEFEKCIRSFAIWIPDNLPDGEIDNYFNALYSAFNRQLSLFSDKVVKVTDKKSLLDPRIGVMLAIENGAALNGSLLNIQKMADLGVKLFTITWNGENSLGYGQLKNRRLKPFGRECIPLLEENGIIIDVSHLSKRGFDDVCAICKKPFVASHSNSMSVTKHNRNLNDDQIREIIRRRGLIGLNFYRGFLNKNFDKASEIDILRHAEYILSLGGEDVLAIGTDFDGADTINGFKKDIDLLKLEPLFLQNGFSREITDKILFKNAEKFFIENL